MAFNNNGNKYSMHYYQFNIADYRKDTQHLSPIEHYIYRSLLDWMYLDETPIPKRIPTILRKLRLDAMHSTDVRQVLDDFFTEHDDGFIQDRVMFEIKEYKRKVKSASDAGKASAKARKAKRGAGSERSLNERTSEVQPTNNHKPITNNQEPITKDQKSMSSPAVSDPVPYSKIVDLYHEKLPQLPAIQKMTKARQASIRQRWKSGDLPALDNWSNFFDYIADSDFLMGKSTPYNGKRPFVANLEWVTKEANFTKILEGRYHGV